MQLAVTGLFCGPVRVAKELSKSILCIGFDCWPSEAFKLAELIDIKGLVDPSLVIHRLTSITVPLICLCTSPITPLLNGALIKPFVAR